MNWLIITIVLLLAHKQYLASPIPLKLPGHTQRLTPYIKYWEPANFERAPLDEAHQKHIEQKRHRRKRDLNGAEYGPAHTIRLKFFAHDREFRLVLRQDPLSVFANDVEIENSLGPMDYDISRIYTGSLEDDENSHVHAILTSDNLLDGTIETSSEHYYVEPAHRYSPDLRHSGVHSIVYKVSDVNPQRLVASPASSASSAAEHCASERLRRSMLLNDLKRRKANEGGGGVERGGGGKGVGVEEMQAHLSSRRNDKTSGGQLKEEHGAFIADSDSNGVMETQTLPSRSKRWLPDELSTPSSDDRQDPPLPLDLDVPYNDDFGTYRSAEAKTYKPFVRTKTSTTTAAIITTKAPTTKAPATNASKERNLHAGSVITWRTSDERDGVSSTPRLPYTTRTTTNHTTTKTTTKFTRNRNVIANIFSPSPETKPTTTTTTTATTTTTTTTSSTMRTTFDDNYFGNNYSNNNVRKTYTKHKNIIVSNYNRSISNTFGNSSTSNNNKHFNTPYDKNYNNNHNNGIYNDPNDKNNNNFINNFFNTNWTTIVNANDRPSHKTHVEIITKNGATKKPNIIVNNYNPPEITLTPTNNNNNNNNNNNQQHHHPNFNSMLMTNVLSGRGHEDNDIGSHNGGNSARALYDRKITCMMYLQADHTFFQKMGSDEASIEAITRHVQRANTIYKNTDFNNDGKPDNITFMIKRIKVHNANALKDPAYRFPGSYGVEKFLELFSEEDYDAFCLAYMFTYRDFEMGTLGLAWTGDLKNAGGVCEKNGHYRGSLKSLNTGIVTLLNYGKHVPPAVSHVTLAHEIGHNFGSPHDPEQCTPGGEDGNFIMFARATSGDKKNNNKFSPCSLKSIEPVLNAKARSLKGCFTEPQTSICGNGVVEQGEQCDCGWEEDCKDSCCFPMSRHPRIDEQPCTLTPNARCSPSQGPCCTTDCKVKFGDKCRDDNGCRDPSFCDGHMPQCPPSVNKPNKTICNKEFVCYMGDCTGSICLAYGLESCQCIPGPADDKIKSCELCCKLPGEDNPCRSSFEWNEPPFDVPDMFAKPGTPCNDYNGYCDVFQKCREVDPNGPLATLRKLLLSEESIANFKKWIQQNWYTVALAVLGVFILLILSAKLLTKRSNLKLKSVTIIHSATTETVRLPDDNNGVIVHTAVRTKVPFKKKVRGERANNPNKLPQTTNSSNASKKAAAAAAAKMTQKTVTARGKVLSPAPAASEQQLKKTARTKKNRISVPPPLQSIKKGVASAGVAETKANVASLEVKRSKQSKFKSKQHSNKEIIDYSTRSAQAASVSSSAVHTNTFGKVQKWLLESPIVAQPLSHIEHSSKVRKVMSKSQSTPERLVAKSPQKTKSMGNLANDKVKLQVVYKPPFKFSLRLSKNATVKTHVVAPGGGGGVGAVAKMKRKTRSGPGNESKRFGNVEGGSRSSGGGERIKRSALLLRTSSKNDEDNQVLTLNEPNYETLNPKSTSKFDNPFYENLQYTQVSESRSASGSDAIAKASSAGSGPKMSRSSSKTNLEATQSQRPHNYNRSNSLTTAGNPFAVMGCSRNARKLSDSNSINLSRNFGSTQNLINTSQSNLAKSKKRSSLNLKSSMSKSSKEPPPPTKRSNSNMNLRRESIASNQPNLPPEALQPPLRRSSSHSAQQQPHQLQQQQLPASGSATVASQQQQQQSKLPTYAAQRSARASVGNIPRASLNLSMNSTSSANSNNKPAASNAPAFSSSNNSSNFNKFNATRQSPPPETAAAATNDASLAQVANSTNATANSHELLRSRSTAQQQVQQQPQLRSNSIRQQKHNHHPPPLPPSAAQQQADRDRELPSDLEVMVSDVENLETV